MNNDCVLVDTSAWIEFSNKKPGESKIGDEVRRLIEEDKAVSTEIVFIEIAAGLKTKGALDFERDRFAILNTLEIDQRVWNAAAENVFSLRRKGFTPNLVDLLIATVAMVYGVRLIHRDRHYSGMAKIVDLVEYSVD